MGANAEAVLLLVLVQLIVIIGTARLAGSLFRRLGQPQVCGEIAAGLLLGPSLFGGLFPGIFHLIFDPSVEQTFRSMSQIGLILLLFIIGIEFDFSHLRTRSRTSAWVSLAGMALPFTLGAGAGWWLQPMVAPGAMRLGFALFLAVALSITALPILGRILIEYNLHRTPLGALTITAAAIDDAVGWILLALVTGIVRSQASWSRAGIMVLETAAYAGFLLLIGRPLLKRWARAAMRRGRGELGMVDLTVLLMVVLASAVITNAIGIFSIFGAFMIGTMLFDEHEFRGAVIRRLGDFVTVFFLPIFFTYTGLRTDIGSMSGGLMWAFCGLVIVISVVGKLGGCTLAARLCGLSWRDAGAIGVLMNTRALMALIVINVGYELHILPPQAFFMLVLMAVVTTYMTAPLLKRLLAHTAADSLAARPALAPPPAAGAAA